MEQRPKVVRHCFNMCCVGQHAEDTPRWNRQGTTPADDIAAIANEPVVYVPDENHSNPSREARHLRDPLKDYFNPAGVLSGQRGQEQKKLASINPFQDYPIISRTFI